MSTKNHDLLQYGAEELAKLAVIYEVDPGEAIYELARRIENRHRSGRPVNPVAVKTLERLLVWFRYHPMEKPDW